MEKIKNNKILIIFLLSAFIALVAFLGLFKRIDRWAEDMLYQSPSPVSGDIVIIGIDEKALSQIGPYHTWDRNVMASALEKLAENEDSMPAVVAIDTLYAGHTDEEADAHLVEAASKLPNVVIGDLATFGTSKNVDDAGSITITKNAIVEFEQPYDELKEVTIQGHINAAYDPDGIMRHAILYEKPDGEKVYSMAFTVAKAYADAKGITISEPKADKCGVFYIPFYTKPEGFYDGVSIADLINGDVPADYFAGKIVYIGPYAVALQDAYYTSIARATQMYGVEIQANVTEGFLANNRKAEVSDLIQALILFVICFASGYFLLYKSNLTQASIVAAVIIVADLIICKVAYENGAVCHVLWIALSVLILYLLSIALRYVKAAIERAKVTRTFERYVDPEIVGELLKEGDALELGGKMYDIAVLFVDVRGFTTMSEALDPPTVVEIINKYLTLTTECIMRYHGTLDKFVGDCTMAFWNAPVKQEDPAYLACLAAMDMAKGAVALGEELKEKYGRSVSFGIGVHFGPAVVGNIGAPQRMDYTAIGDTVNTAARLEANAPGGTIYISRAVAEALGERAKVTSLGGSIKLKGKAEGFEVLILDELKRD